MVANSSIALSLASAVLGTHHHASAFTSPSQFAPRGSSLGKINTPAELAMTSAFFADATSQPRKTPEVKQQIDSNGNVFSEGAVVAVAPNKSIKAYHVPKSSFGTFDPTNGKYVPLDEANATRGTSCLILTGGLRGVVKKVYDANEWDRTHPILVKFEAGLDREGEEGGFDVPRAFAMHFDADEIEVLDS